MTKGNVEKRIAQLENHAERSRPQKSVDSILVDDSNYLKKEADILQAQKEGVELIVINTINGRNDEEESAGYAEYLERSLKI